MRRLLSIEFFKLRNSRYFWLLSGLFVVFLISVPIASKAFLDWVESQGGEIVDNLTAGEIPLFDFVDIWQNLTWVYKSFSLFLGFITVISVCNEYNYGTLKQNVIDGMSRREFLWSKVLFLVILALFFSFLVLIIGLIMGYAWSPVTEFPFVVKHIEFVGAYFLHLVAFQLFCLLVSLLIKRAGITIALLTFYVYVIERIISLLTIHYYKQEWLEGFYPVAAMGNIIPIPFPKYIMRETQTYIGWDDLGILLFYMALMYFLADRLIVKKDLR